MFTFDPINIDIDKINYATALQKRKKSIVPGWVWTTNLSVAHVEVTAERADRLRHGDQFTKVIVNWLFWIFTFKAIIVVYEKSLSSRGLAGQASFFWSFFYTNCLLSTQTFYCQFPPPLFTFDPINIDIDKINYATALQKRKKSIVPGWVWTTNLSVAHVEVTAERADRLRHGDQFTKVIVNWLFWIFTFKAIIVVYEKSLSSRGLAGQASFFWSFFYTNCLQRRPFGAFSVKQKGIFNTYIYRNREIESRIDKRAIYIIYCL